MTYLLRYVCTRYGWVTNKCFLIPHSRMIESRSMELLPLTWKSALSPPYLSPKYGNTTKEASNTFPVDTYLSSQINL